ERRLIQAYVYSQGVKPWLPTDDLSSLYIMNDPDSILQTDSEGNTLAVWRNGKSLGSSYLANGSTSWQEIAALDLDDSYIPQKLTITGPDEAAVVITKGEDYYTADNVAYCTYTQENGWSGPQIIAPECKDWFEFRDFVIDSQGNILCSWIVESSAAIVVKRY